MRVDKSVLEKLSDYDLEQYIKAGNKYVRDANIYAYEILKSRGRTFSSEENERILALITIKEEKERKEREEETPVHPYHKKAADLVYLSGALGIANAIWKYDTFNSGFAVFIAIVVLLLIFGIGYIISKGVSGIKYVLLILLLLGFAGLPAVIENFKSDLVGGIINILQSVLQIWAVILLFRIPKAEKNK